MSDASIYTIGWISALRLESVAAQEFLDEEHKAIEWQHPDDGNHYTLGSIGKHNVVMAVLPTGDNGIAAATMVAKDLKHTFSNVRVCLMVGIGGGMPSDRHDIRLGDVVVSAPSYHEPSGNHGGVVQYDYGKTIEARCFQSTHYLNRPPTALLTALNALQTRYERKGNNIEASIGEIIKASPRLRKKYGRPDQSTDKLYSSRDRSLVDRPERGDDDDNPAVHEGLIASAESFMENARVRDELAEELDVLCFEMEAAGLMNTFPCMVIRGICDYADARWHVTEWRGYAAMAAAAVAKDLLGMVVPSQLAAEKSIAQLLGQIGADVGNMKTVTSSTKVEVGNLREAVLNADQRAVLDRLPASNASFDSTDEEVQPRCFPGTRVDILEQVISWAQHSDASMKSIFWLNGMAGTGKSTISRSVARCLDEKGILGLASRRPAIAPRIKEAIDADSSICTKGLLVQFDKLLREPLSKVAQETSHGSESLVVIIDALDDRPELPIYLGFKSIEGDYQDIALHQIAESAIEHDIRLFLDHETKRIRDEHNVLAQLGGELPLDWPGIATTLCLVNMAVPLFIFAATEVLRYSTKTQRSRMEATYRPVLDRLLVDLSCEDRDKALGRFRQIVGSIIILASPLSTIALSRLLSMAQKTIDNQLRRLHSVLRVPREASAPVRLLHLSFRDFLSDPDKRDKNPFWIDEEHGHLELAHRCLAVMTESLRTDICELKLKRLEASMPSQVLTVEVIIHHGWSAIGKSSLLSRHGSIADATRTLCLPHEEREFVGL
ncbi:phosphorylase superfamily domain-containing protein [Hirsutella rhossiliensis]|uniref:Phosphorylase superfamily domain-containing protein n=1 Tax=Hirsutella rhossiliensis TaxID=111463 RepID=A0A9P8N3Y0_9HYPO|nr:phosphorylase superfamily domain-containing protein [Hirsutella rhossiliensis]KAH0967198.1 phosphorylase superfamily domain-containing protein [Hirsutella rhossiliensis]